MPPFALKFSVSAPGKVILFGEHSVVYGKPALAASINKRSTLIFESQQNDTLEIDFSMLNVSLSVSVDDVRKILEKFSFENCNSSGDFQVPFCERIIDGVDNFESMDRNQKVSIFCLFYLLYRFSSTNQVSISGFKMTLSSDLAVGAGTGSSASFSVCLAAALYHYFRILRSSSEGDAKSELFSAQDKKLINDYAFACEQIIHGRASGIDNFVCTYGSIIEMVSEDDEKNHNKIFRALENVSMFRIFLINSGMILNSRYHEIPPYGIGRSTAKMVQQVRDLYSRNTVVVEALLETMGLIASSACSVLAELKKNEQNSSGELYVTDFKKLEDLVSLNHGLLATLGVSHVSLDKIINITKKYDLHSKITGAGGGGFVFTVIPPYKPNDLILNCKHELEETGFVVDNIVIGGAGLEIKIL